MKRFVCIIALAMASCMAMAQAMVVKGHAFYSKKTVTWADAAGVKHTNSLTDEATDPRHIMALLKEIYTNKDIPGIKYGGYKSDGTTREGSVDYKHYKGDVLSGAWDVEVGKWFLLSPKDYTPNEEGYTTILIKVKQGFVSSRENCESVESTLRYITSAIESAQVVCGDYLEGENGGALYKFDGDASRFFFLSKGRARRTGSDESSSMVRFAPFWGMFEEYSPTVAAAGATVNDFYAQMMQGKVYPVVHDCATVLNKGHEFNMTADKEVKPLEGVVFFLPNKRLMAWDGRDVQENGGQFRYSNYNPQYAPTTCIYNIALEAKGEEVEGMESQWTVTLTWTSNLNTITGCDVEQVYFIFTRNADGTLVPLLDADGNQVTTEDNTYTYQVDKQADEYGITYVVAGQPKVQSLSMVYSNDATVTIPGKGQEQWSLAIGVTPMSDYDIDEEVNRYKNYVMMNNNAGTCIYGRNLNMENAPKITFYRYPVNHTEGEAVKVATVSITGVTANGKSRTYGYSVAYDNQLDADEAAYPATTGTFTSKGDGEKVDFGDFKICDQFYASTATNDHPGSYEYCAEYTNNANEKHSSSMAKVKVFKTTVEANDQSFSVDYVEGDNVRSAHASEAPIETTAPSLSFVTENNSQIYYYSAIRQTPSGDKKEVCRAQRVASGSYVIYQDGQQGATYAPGASTIVKGDESEYGTYKLTPVIHVFRTGADDEHNTYGAPVNRVTRLGLQVIENAMEKSEYTFTDKNGVVGRYYKAEFNIATLGAVLDGEIARYRVWRVTPNGMAMEVADQYMPRLNQDSHPADMYVYAGAPVLYPSCKNEFVMGGSHSGETCFPRRYDESTITFTDVFGAKSLAEGEEMAVTYVVRVYAQPAEASSLAPMMAEGLEDDDPGLAGNDFYIAEHTAQVIFNSDVHTAVMDIDMGAKSPLRVQYVNMLGCTSDTPFEGMNIVVTTFTDGTMMKEKKMY